MATESTTLYVVVLPEKRDLFSLLDPTLMMSGGGGVALAAGSGGGLDVAGMILIIEIIAFSCISFNEICI